ncbi:DUF1642 domain-containing protein [Lactococcus lactis subsp. cremoris]|uniref:Prophage pi3 protein 37 n=2 Tax=root TaxID=1 RepID=Q9CFQ5_LACLA|nr:prophage pi3 protein 37 [Lactococcus lactis subsp. lactis Il1403]AYV53133.1 DUF1642 domain-containing protein [Lactococcus lactis]MRL48347.1 DUF1642 domain-containing protein [Lactococcus lactis subsp. lactis]MRM77124.1 DUF1642 domain-containing protein [Lactococcus cremoris]
MAWRTRKMTKFEEEFKALTSWDWVNVDLIQQILTRFGNWHSDEEFQAEKDARKKEYEIHQDIYSKTSKKLNKAELEITNLKSQLQQQALPVVPECVAGAIESIPDHYSAFEAISLINAKVNALPEENEDWLPVYNWLCEGVENQDVFALAFITGKYEVEKPQLFYLKNKLTGMWLMRDEVDEVYPYDHTFNRCHRGKFTQQEIDSMETGSYEQIEVAE